jgi:hypothetical protein
VFLWLSTLFFQIMLLNLITKLLNLHASHIKSLSIIQG